MNNEVKESSTRNRVLKPEQAAKEPFLYRVLLHNDDFTPVEFVVGILEKIFHLDSKRATQIALEAHKAGRAICGLFSKDVAETKAYLVCAHAEENDHPLRCSAEPAT